MNGRRRNILQVLVYFFLLAVYYLLFSSVAIAADATLYLSPITGTYTIDTTIPIQIMVSSGGESVNAIEGKLTYDPKEIEIESVTKNEALMSSWTVEPVYDNTLGTLSFGGFLSTSTVLDRAVVLSFVGIAKRSGEVRIRFATGAAVHAADGTGGNLLSTLNGGIYAIIPKESDLTLSPDTPGEALFATSTEEVLGVSDTSSTTPGEVLGAATATIMTSLTHPDQNAWYALSTSTLSWDMPDGVTHVRLALDKKQEGEGVRVYNAPIHEKIIDNIHDGVWYVHLTREFADAHTDNATYRLQIDTMPPSNVSVSEKPRAHAYDPRVAFLVTATDTLSGVDHYEFIVDQGEAVSWVPDGTHEYHARTLPVGTHELLVRALDRAGNKTEAHTQFVIEYLPTPTIVPSATPLTEGDHLSGVLESTPNATLTLFFMQGGEVVKEEVVLDSTGRGVFHTALVLSPGPYEVWALLHEESGAVSRESEHLHGEVRSSVFGVIKRHPYVLPVVLFFIVFLFAMRFFWRMLRGSDALPQTYDDEENDVYEEEDVQPVRKVIPGAVVLTQRQQKSAKPSRRVMISKH